MIPPVGLLSKLKLWAVGAAVAVAGAFALFLRVRQDGKNELLAEQQRNRDALQAEYDRIDADAPDLDASIERLRRLATHK